MKFRLLRREWFVLPFLLAAVHPGPAQETKGQAGPARVDRAKAAYRGGMVSPPLAKPKFTLTDTSDVSFDFASQTQGYTTLLFFGYTHCPDMCPLQMHMLAQALKEIPPAIATQFKVIFVTT